MAGEDRKAVLSGAEIVEAARGWIGTRFMHQGRLRASEGFRGGCDCLGVLVGVAAELALQDKNGRPLASFDEQDYGHIPDSGHLRKVLEALLLPVAVHEMREGDVLLLRLDGAPQHLAILTQHPQGGMGIVHALASVRKVTEHRLDGQWRSRIAAVYRVAGVAAP